MLMALVLSHLTEMGSVMGIPRTYIIYFIHITYVQHDVVAMYSTSTMDNDTESCFLLCQPTRFSPK